MLCQSGTAAQAANPKVDPSEPPGGISVPVMVGMVGGRAPDLEDDAHERGAELAAGVLASFRIRWVWRESILIL